jgi:hypothetical protein
VPLPASPYIFSDEAPTDLSLLSFLRENVASALPTRRARHLRTSEPRRVRVDRINVETESSAMNFGKFHFGAIEIDGVTYERDVVIDRDRIRKRKKKPSKKFREEFGHTPVSVEEEIPWKCKRLIVGTGRYGSLPVMNEVKLEARRRKVALLILPTDEAIQTLANQPEGTNAILHVTC